MKIRLAIIAAMLTAAAACSSSPTSVDQRSPRSASPLHDGTAPPPPDTAITRGGGGLGSGN